MIKIRYRDPHELSPGLHGAAERQGRSTTVYLLPGLSAAQRRAALRRLRISARRGYGPQLPAPLLAVALLADRVRTTVGRTGAVFRSHPAGSTVPVMVVSAGAIAFLALSAVSIQVIHPARNSGSSSFTGAAAAGLPVNAGSGSAASPRSGPGLADPGQAGPNGQIGDLPGSGSRPGTGAPTGNGTGANGGAAPGSGQDPASGPRSGGGTTLAGSAGPTPAPGATASGTAAAAASSAAPAPAASSASASASPTPSASKTGGCLDLGPLGICL